MKIADNSTPVVVLSSAHHCGLGITRSLARLGVRVFNVDSTRSAPAFFSRYCQGRFVWDLSRTSPAASLRRLAAISAGAGHRCVLIPTTDREAIFVEDNANELREHFIFPATHPPLVRSLCSKREFHRLAVAQGIPTARTACPSSKVELLRFAAEVSYPVIVKGAGALWRAGSSKVIARNREELLRVIARMDDARVGDLVLQEYIPAGADWMFNGYFDRHSQCLAGFTGRKLRQFPANTGVTSLGECRHNPTVAATAVAFLQAVRYQGIVDMDFRLDRRDGTYKLLDVNPRVGGTFRLFSSEQGLDMVRALYLDLTGQAVTASQPIEGRRWMVEDFDLVAVCSAFWRKMPALREWAGSLCAADECAFLDVHDPLPVLAMAWGDMLELFRRLPPRHQRPLSADTMVHVRSASQP